MPLACRVEPGGKRYWVGADVVLGPLAEPAYQRAGRFELRAETLCRQLFTADRRVTGALIEHLPSGVREVVEAKVVIVAADTLRTPQLLWASGIRPRALGHYLNDQPQVLCAVSLHEHLIAQTRASLTAEQQLDPSARVLDDTTVGVFWVPFHDPTHPFHGQVMHLDVSPIPLNVSEVRADPRHVVGLGWFCRKELRYEDHVAFTDEQRDYLGMPRMQIHYALTPADEEAIAGAKQEVARAASALGEPILGDEPHLIPAGSSLHYQGTVRLGESDDGQSVCDPYSRVWGFSNLFVGGNGVIPTATACNPTLTSVALAVRACDRIAALLS
jgi:pyranose oxidase